MNDETKKIEVTNPDYKPEEEVVKEISFPQKVWKRLSTINVNEHTNDKGGLTYLSWAWAWGTLMENYPESKYEFDEPVMLENKTVEVWVKLIIKEDKEVTTRRMWLPVMDYKNKAIASPSTRDISDTRMRCLVKALAMFGLGHYLYAGEDLPKEADEIDYTMQIAEAIEAHQDTCIAIRDGINDGQLDMAVEAWDELDQDEKISLWVAPSKGGFFTTEERKIMKSPEWLDARQ